MLIWQSLIASRAVLWDSGVTQAQQSATTLTGTSGSVAFARIALDITQMPVQRPIRVISSIGEFSFMVARIFCNSTEPKVGFSMHSGSVAARG